MQNEEKLFYRGRQHPVVFLWPIILLMISIIAYFLYPFLQDIILISMVLAVIWLCMNTMNFLVTSIEVTNYRLTFKSGIFIRKMKDFQLNRIEGVKVRQTLLGEFMGYGTLIIMGTGGTQNSFDTLTEPRRVRQLISKNIHDMYRKPGR